MDEERYEKRCAHCGEPLGARDKVCPRCGADANEDRTPKTIYELRAYCARHNMPLAQMRFFLGEDCPEPRAFGIYQDDDGDFVVYKNKADGVRAIRYRGPDEARAVNEIYEKLLSEIAIRRQKKRVQRGDAPRKAPKRKRSRVFPVLTGLLITVVVAAAIAFFSLALKFGGPDRGYYYYDDDYYYCQDDDWYWYDEDSSDWLPWYVDEALQDNAEDYYVGRSYDESYGVENFYDSDYYNSGARDDSDDWDDDDWDSWDDWDDDDWDDWDDDDWDDWDDWDTDWDSDW